MVFAITIYILKGSGLEVFYLASVSVKRTVHIFTDSSQENVK